jgi:hypothetical protein
MDMQKMVEVLEREINSLRSARENDIVILHALIRKLGGEVLLNGNELRRPENECVLVTSDAHNQTVTFKIIKLPPSDPNNLKV